jgi:hypothetical protein
MRFARAALTFRSPHLIIGPPGVFHPLATPRSPPRKIPPAQHGPFLFAPFDDTACDPFPEASLVDYVKRNGRKDTPPPTVRK